MIRDTSRSEYLLRPYTWTDATTLPALVKQNQDVLSVDFPEAEARYSDILTSVRSIRRARHSTEMEAFTVRKRTEYVSLPSPSHNFTPGNSSPSAVSNMAVGVATIADADPFRVADGSGADIEGIVIAGWIDRPYRNQGIASKVGHDLVSRATCRAISQGKDKIITLIRPENEISIHVAQKLGFKALGGAINYAKQVGDSVEMPRQLFVRSVL